MIKPEKSYNQKTITKRNCGLFKTTYYFSKKKALSGEQLRTQTLYPQTEKNETSEEIEMVYSGTSHLNMLTSKYQVVYGGTSHLKHVN